MGTPLFLSSGPQNDRLKYVTGTPPSSQSATGFELAAGALITGKPCVVMAVYISISSALGGTIFIQFYDSKTVIAPFANVASYDLCSEPLTTPGGTFIWQPGSAEASQYQYPRLRKSVRTCRDIDNGIDRLEPISEMLGYPMNNGLFIVASTSKIGLTAAADNLIHIAAFLRSPSEQDG